MIFAEACAPVDSVFTQSNIITLASYAAGPSHSLIPNLAHLIARSDVVTQRVGTVVKLSVAQDMGDSDGSVLMMLLRAVRLVSTSRVKTKEYHVLISDVVHCTLEGQRR